MTATAKAPTGRQREILEWVRAYCDSHGYSPTNRELCRAFEIRSPNGAQCHLNALRKKGLITWIEGAPRTLRVTEDA